MLKKIKDLVELTAMFIANVYNAETSKECKRVTRLYKQDIRDILNNAPELSEEDTYLTIVARDIVKQQLKKQHFKKNNDRGWIPEMGTNYEY